MIKVLLFFAIYLILLGLTLLFFYGSRYRQLQEKKNQRPNANTNTAHDA